MIQEDTEDRVVTKHKFTVTGTAGSRVTGVATLLVEAFITGGSGGPSLGEVQMDSSSINFLPLIPKKR